MTDLRDVPGQEVFYRLLDKYSNGIEPLSNWITADLVGLIDAADAELQNRAPPDSDPYDNAQEDYE